MEQTFDRLDAIEQKIENTNDNVTLLIQAVTGNPLTNQGGMVKDIEDTKEDIKQINKRLTDVEINQKKWMFAVTVVIALLSFLNKIIELFHK